MLNHHLSPQSPMKQLALVVTAAVASLTLQAFTICGYAGFVQRYQHPPPSRCPCAVYISSGEINFIRPSKWNWTLASTLLLGRCHSAGTDPWNNCAISTLRGFRDLAGWSQKSSFCLGVGPVLSGRQGCMTSWSPFQYFCDSVNCTLSVM